MQSQYNTKHVTHLYGRISEASTWPHKKRKNRIKILSDPEAGKGFRSVHKFGLDMGFDLLSGEFSQLDFFKPKIKWSAIR